MLRRGGVGSERSSGWRVSAGGDVVVAFGMVRTPPRLGTPLREARKQVLQDSRDFVILPRENGVGATEVEEEEWLRRVQESRMGSPGRKGGGSGAQSDLVGNLQAQVADVSGSVEALRQQVHVILTSSTSAGRSPVDASPAASMDVLEVDPGLLLLRAVAARDHLDVRALAGAGRVPGAAACSVDAAGALYGVSPLVLACSMGDRTSVRLLLDAGADPNALCASPGSRQDGGGNGGDIGSVGNAGGGLRLDSSPLGVAVREGHFHLVWDLVNAGADIDVASAAGQAYGPQVRETLKTLPPPEDGWTPPFRAPANEQAQAQSTASQSPAQSTAIPPAPTPAPTPRLSVTTLPVQSGWFPPSPSSTSAGTKAAVDTGVDVALAPTALFETPRQDPAPHAAAPFTASERALLSAAGLRSLNMR